ncbi:MAG: dihydrofolate reductase family protein [Egibacteraceae bacterium]
MRQLLPVLAEHMHAYDIYRPENVNAPLLRVNMVSSVDGAAADEHGRTAGLGLPGDHEVFRALRALADAIVVGAGTVRVEGYGPHRVGADLRARRARDGRTEPAPIVVVSGSLDLDFSAPLFTEAAVPTVVVTCEAAPADRRRVARQAGRVLVAGAEQVDAAAAVEALRTELGLSSLLCEGGPTLNEALFGAGLVDELCLTLTPRMVGAGPRILRDLPQPLPLELAGLCEEDGELYARYALP